VGGPAARSDFFGDGLAPQEIAMSSTQTLLDSFRRPLWAAWALLAAAGGYYLWTRHERHVLEVLPYLFLLACPLMHVFMHRGYGHGGHHHGPGPSPGDDNRG
jgi:hypothetical protein